MAFHSADFSLPASGKRTKGYVTLVRSPKERKRWHQLLEEGKATVSNYPDGPPPLYVHGHGDTLKAAIADANDAASYARPIIIKEK